jgi:hypothetical protein
MIAAGEVAPVCDSSHSTSAHAEQCLNPPGHVRARHFFIPSWRTKSEYDRISGVPLRTCIVSYSENDCQRSVEVVAETLHEAVALGLKAMAVPSETLHLLSFNVLVKSPQVYHSISGASLSAWLAQPGKNPKEQALKSRLKELLRGPE